MICSLLPKVEVDPTELVRVESAQSLASHYLLAQLDESEDDTLWTGEAWSNGQILWALASAEVFPVEDTKLLDKTIRWFRTHQTATGNWADVEDTASAILGLIHLLECVWRGMDGYHVRNSLRAHLQKSVQVPALLLKLPFIQHNNKIDCWSVNFTRKRRSTLAIIGLVVTAIATVLQIVDFTWNHWMRHWIK
jgi:hypothetical protein